MLLHSIPLYECTSLLILLLIDTFTISHKLPQILWYMDICLRMELLDHKVDVCLALLNTDK